MKSTDVREGDGGRCAGCGRKFRGRDKPVNPSFYNCSRCGYSFPLNVHIVSGVKDPPRRVYRVGFWEGWVLTYWPGALLVLWSLGVNGVPALWLLSGLFIPWMLIGWTVKRVSARWTAMTRRKKALIALDRVREEAERVIRDQ